MSRLNASLLLLFAALCWGAGNVANKAILADFGPIGTLGFRCLIGASIILPFVSSDVAKLRRLSRRELCNIVAVSGLFVVAMLLQQIAFGSTTVTNVGFLINTGTVMTPIAAWFLQHERPTLSVQLAAPITLAGIFLLGGASLTSFAIGDVLSLGSAAVFAVWLVLLGAIVTRTNCPGFITLVQFSLTAVVCLAICPIFEPISSEGIQRGGRLLLFLGIIATGLAFGLQSVAQQHVSASIVAVVMSAESLFGALGGGLILGERLSWTAGLGALLIVLAVLIVQINAGSLFAVFVRQIFMSRYSFRRSWALLRSASPN
jgi:drug/metabolite transporter (DMT)-like permease